MFSPEAAELLDGDEGLVDVEEDVSVLTLAIVAPVPVEVGWYVVISADALEIVEAVGSVVLGCEVVVGVVSDVEVVAAAAEFVVVTSVVEVDDALGNVVAVIVLCVSETASDTELHTR